MKMRQAVTLLHAYCNAYGEATIIRRIVLAVTYKEVNLTERWRHPPQSTPPMESSMRKRTALPKSVTEHQGSRRVGPPVTDESGVTDPLTAMYIAIGGIIYMTIAFWGIVVSMSSNTDTRWF